MLSVYDIPGSILCIIVLWMIFSAKARKYPVSQRKIFVNAFILKIIYTVIFALITAYYYQGGDSEMFLYAVRDIKQALVAKDFSFSELVVTENVGYESELAYYFQQDDIKYPVFGFMGSASNFLVPKLGLIPFIVFFESYLAMCLVFSFFALAGMIRLYKLFFHYFPHLQREVALATLFLPSACYWSSGFLKDSICFGSVGFLLYGLFNIFIRHKNQVISVFWVALSGYFIFTTKVYILLALIPGIGFWLFGELSAGVKTLILKRVLTFASLIIAGLGAYFLVTYLTSASALSKFSIDNLLESSDFSRGMYEVMGDRGSNFQITTSNPVLLMLNGMVATFFRPFLWEVNSGIVLFSALESLAFLALILFLLFKKGFLLLLKKIFEQPILILCFSFSIIFATSIGISTGNFGSLSRYKIPCLPFYLMFILAGYHLTGLAYPRWMQKVLQLISKNKSR